MAMTQAGRAAAIYNAISSSSANFSKLSAAEKSAMQTQIQQVWGGGDLVYIQTNAEADPGTFIATVPTIISSAPGVACTGTSAVTGKGTIA